jgi:hypothetical protein
MNGEARAKTNASVAQTMSVMSRMRPRGSLMSVDSLEFWKNLFEITGVALLLLTFVAGAGVLWFSRRLNDRQAAQLRQFDKDLTDAKTKLGEQQERAAAAEAALKGVDAKTEGFRLAIAKANERASKAQESLALAEQHAAEANAKAEGFRLDIAKANERAASANETAERERLARLELEARLADRVLTPQAKEQLARLAAKLPKGSKIDILIYGDSLEIANIMVSIRDSLATNANVRVWKVTGGGSVRGILIGTDPKSDPKIAEVAAGIAPVLNASSIAAGPWEFQELEPRGMRSGPPEPSDAPIRISIGSKQ